MLPPDNLLSPTPYDQRDQLRHEQIGVERERRERERERLASMSPPSRLKGLPPMLVPDVPRHPDDNEEESEGERRQRLERETVLPERAMTVEGIRAFKHMKVVERDREQMRLQQERMAEIERYEQMLRDMRKLHQTRMKERDSLKRRKTTFGEFHLPLSRAERVALPFHLPLLDRKAIRRVAQPSSFTKGVALAEQVPVIHAYNHGFMYQCLEPSVRSVIVTPGDAVGTGLSVGCVGRTDQTQDVTIGTTMTESDGSTCDVRARVAVARYGVETRRGGNTKGCTISVSHYCSCDEAGPHGNKFCRHL
ncbi:hypothetical protein KIPB_006155, partial [Kipferlia bialata]|eukprot:g6155.t1